MIVRKLQRGLRSRLSVLTEPSRPTPPDELVGLEDQIYDEFLNLVFGRITSGLGQSPVVDPAELGRLLRNAMRRVKPSSGRLAG